MAGTMNVFLISLGSAASPIFHGGSSAGPGSNLHMVWPRRRGGRERTREGLKPSGPGRGPPGRRRGRRSSAVRAASLPPPAGAAAAPPGHRNVTAQRPSVGPSARPAPAPRRATRPASARVSEAASPLSPFSHTGWGGGGRLEGPGILRRGGEALTITLWKMSPPSPCPHAPASPFPSRGARRPPQAPAGGGTSRARGTGWASPPQRSPVGGRRRPSGGKRQNHCGSQAAGGAAPPLRSPPVAVSSFSGRRLCRRRLPGLPPCGRRRRRPARGRESRALSPALSAMPPRIFFPPSATRLGRSPSAAAAAAAAVFRLPHWMERAEAGTEHARRRRSGLRPRPASLRPPRSRPRASPAL